MQVPPCETVDVPVLPALSVYPLLMFIHAELLRLFRNFARMSATSGCAAQLPYLQQVENRAPISVAGSESVRVWQS